MQRVHSYLSFTSRLFGAACLKTEELRWGSPTATPPFEPFSLAPKEMLKDILPFLELNGQFGKLTDRTEGTPVPEPVEGALSKLYIYTVAYASGSERWVPFRVFPCFSVAILPLMLCLISVENWHPPAD